MSTELVPFKDLWDKQLQQDPELRERWERTAFARAVAIAVIRHRAAHNLSQGELAKQLGMRLASVVRIEEGEHNPTLEVLQRLAKGLGQRFILSIEPPDQHEGLVLPARAQVLSDFTASDGVRVLAATG